MRVTLSIVRQGVHVIVSRQALEAIIGRAILDAEFCVAFFTDPGSALASYDLTAPELEALKLLDAESLDACARMLGGRILRILDHDPVWSLL
jgi:hypothetical protein